jgi:hypothetical protein
VRSPAQRSPQPEHNGFQTVAISGVGRPDADFTRDDQDHERVAGHLGLASAVLFLHRARAMKNSVFLSYPKPCYAAQQQFVAKVTTFMAGRGFAPRTLGVTDYDMDAPLKSIRRLMLECNGLLTIAFRRTHIESGTTRYRTDLTELSEGPLKDVWFTSPWSQIEPAMAYQIGLPVLILRERGVLDEGILERGVLGLYMPEFDLAKSIDEYLSSVEWNEMLGRWEGFVRAVVETKGNPPRLY